MLSTIGVIGPNANNRKALEGNYMGTASRYYTNLEGIQEYAGEEVRVLTSEGCHLYKNRTSGLAAPDNLLARIIYTVVALSGVWCISLLFRDSTDAYTAEAR